MNRTQSNPPTDEAGPDTGIRGDGFTAGPFIYYELADARVLNVLRTLSEVAADLLSARKTF